MRRNIKRTIRQSRVTRSIRNAFISMLVLLILVIGTGVIYTWYMGQNSADITAAVAEPVEYKPAPVIKPSAPAANAKIGASIQSLTSPVQPGNNTSLTVKSMPGASCAIRVMYDKMPSTDSGLKPQIVDDFGTATWTWTVEPTAPLGTWPMEVTCTHLKQSAVVQASLILAEPTE